MSSHPVCRKLETKKNKTNTFELKKAAAEQNTAGHTKVLLLLLRRAMVSEANAGSRKRSLRERDRDRESEEEEDEDSDELEETSSAGSASISEAASRSETPVGASVSGSSASVHHLGLARRGRRGGRKRGGPGPAGGRNPKLVFKCAGWWKEDHAQVCSAV